MWEPANKDALPTQDDFIHAFHAICALEKELDEAERRVQQLQKAIAARKAWIAPIRKLNDDVLSIIFAECGRGNGKTPIAISVVCRRWRGIVLTTPQAWISLQIPTGGIPDRILEIFLERRGTHLLHISTPSSQTLNTPILKQNIHGIGCISVPEISSANDLVFSNLTSLHISSPKYYLWSSLLTKSKFPALCHLTTTGIWMRRPAGPTFELPPLHSLTLKGRDGLEWLEAIQSCQNSLVSLKIQISVGIRHPPLRLDMPKLERLQFTIVQTSERMVSMPPISSLPNNLINAPRLKTYIQEDKNYFSLTLLSQNIGGITHLRLHYVVGLPVLPHLRVLQVVASLDDCLCTLRILSKVPYGYPKLEYVEFLLPQDTGDIKAARRTLSTAWDIQNLPGLDIRFYDGRWSEDLPGVVHHSWGEGMACSIPLEP